MEKVYWKTKYGKKIDVDEMSIQHLKNTLKMIIRQTSSLPKYYPTIIEETDALSDYESMRQDNFWKPE